MNCVACMHGKRFANRFSKKYFRKCRKYNNFNIFRVCVFIKVIAATTVSSREYSVAIALNCFLDYDNDD